MQPTTLLAQDLEFYLRVYAAVGPIIRKRPTPEVNDALSAFKRSVRKPAVIPFTSKAPLLPSPVT